VPAGRLYLPGKMLAGPVRHRQGPIAAMRESTDKMAAELVAAIRMVVKGPMNFAFGIDGNNAGMLLHRTKSPAALGLQLKKERELKKFTFGVATADKSLLVLDVQGAPLSGLKKRVRLLLREHKITTFTDVRILTGGVEEGEEEAVAAVAVAPAPAAPPATTASPERVTATLTAAKAVWPREAAPQRHAVTLAENDALAQLPPEQLREQNLTQRDPKELFNDKYMTSLVGLKVQGANDEKLKEIMRKLAKGVSPGERKTLIAELATIRGVPAAKLDAEYDRFMILRAQQEAICKEKNEEVVPDLAEDMHKTFMGSNPQLVFGKVIGDAFGVDPVFGALLSPTGGMVGPGNMALQMDDDDPTGYHGIVHDAAGYLFNYHNQGPGYDYLGREAAHGHKISDPLTGQQSGMRYWHEKLDPGVGTVMLAGTIDVVYAVKDLPMNVRQAAEVLRDHSVKAATELKVKIDKDLASARHTVGDAVDQAMHAVGAKVKAAQTALEQAAQEAADAARAAKARVSETTATALDAAKKDVGAVRDEAAKKLQAAWDFIWK
jgi:hypothetical protein